MSSNFLEFLNDLVEILYRGCIFKHILETAIYPSVFTVGNYIYELAKGNIGIDQTFSYLGIIDLKLAPKLEAYRMTLIANTLIDRQNIFTSLLNMQ